MSPSAMVSAEAEWIAQLTSMRTALAELKLPSTTNGSGKSYDIDFDDDDITSGVSGDDVWDFISDDDGDQYSSDLMDEMGVANADLYGPQWLRRKCAEFAKRSSGIDAEDLQGQITALLASDSNDEELQSTLTDIIGFDDLDFVIELISHRKAIMASPFVQNQDDIFMGKLLTKRQREEAQRRRDYEHKNAVLGPSLDRDGPQYPHVYKAHSAGNTLSSGGRKYALPLGSERKEHEKYEEYSIPASKVGTLGAGRKLVEISDMDGLCRRTFKGYKSLNRMQSLVYPVAYQTSENMLICAPTGAVGLS